jgi:hypothetical protein
MAQSNGCDLRVEHSARPSCAVALTQKLAPDDRGFPIKSEDPTLELPRQQIGEPRPDLVARAPVLSRATPRTSSPSVTTAK